MRPAIPFAVVLARLVEQGLRDVAAGVGVEPGHQLQLRAIHIPAAEVGVLGALARLDAMDLPVEPEVLAVGVAVDVRMQQRVIQRRVERGELVGRAAVDTDAAERTVPGGRGAAGDLVDVRARVLGAQVGARVGQADVGDAHAHVDRATPGRVEAHVGARAVAGVRDALGAVAHAARGVVAVRVHGGILPGASRGERLVELGDEIQRVVAVLEIVRQVAAEVAAGDRTSDSVRVVVDADMRVAAADFRIRSTDQQRRGAAGGPGEASRAGARGGAQFGLHAAVERDAVGAGARGLVVVRIGAGVDAVAIVRGWRARDLARDRHERDVAAGAAAAGARQMGQAEAADLADVVFVASGRRGACVVAPGRLRAPLHHAEWHHGAREGIAADTAADQRIDVRADVLRARHDRCHGLLPPGGAQRMRLGVEDDAAEVEVLRRREGQVEVLEGLGEQKAVHRVALGLARHVRQRRVAARAAAIAHEVVEQQPRVRAVQRVVGQAPEGVVRLDDLGPQLVAVLDDLLRPVVDHLRLDAGRLPHLHAGRLQARGAVDVAGERQHGREEGVERAVLAVRALAGVHVGMAVPEIAVDLVGQVAVDRGDARLPHGQAVLVAEQLPALQQVLVVGVRAAGDAGVGARPLPGLDVDGGADQSDPRPPLEGLDQRALCLVVVHRLAGELAQRAEFQQQRTGLGGVGLDAAHLAGLQVHLDIRQARGRVEHGQQAAAEIVGQREQALVARHLVAGEQAAEQADGDLEVLDVEVLVEGQLRGDQFPVLVRFVLQAHDQQRVQAVDRRDHQ